MTKDYYKAQIGNVEVITEFTYRGLLQIQIIAQALEIENYTTEVIERKIKE